jgi:hypothetical protein
MSSQKQKFVNTPKGKKVKLDKYGKIKYKDRAKVIPGIEGVKKLREVIKKLKPIKINY